MPLNLKFSITSNQCNVYRQSTSFQHITGCEAQSAGPVEYTDCISAEE